MAAGELLAGNLFAHNLFVRAGWFWRHAPGSLLAFIIACRRLCRAGRCGAAAAECAPNSIDSMLQWINAYRGKPEPDALPVLVHGSATCRLSRMPKSCGAYIGFIAGVLGANPRRADALIVKMLTIAPADHWVLVRAIAYSGLPNWKVLLLKYVDRMPTRRAMIEKYVGGKLPTLDQISYQNAKPGMIDRIKDASESAASPRKRWCSIRARN